MPSSCEQPTTELSRLQYLTPLAATPENCLPSMAPMTTEPPQCWPNPFPGARTPSQHPTQPRKISPWPPVMRHSTQLVASSAHSHPQQPSPPHSFFSPANHGSTITIIFPSSSPRNSQKHPPATEHPYTAAYNRAAQRNQAPLIEPPSSPASTRAPLRQPDQLREHSDKPLSSSASFAVTGDRREHPCRE